MKTFNLGISTCPNDTYIFGALLRGDVFSPFQVSTIMEDVQYLNNLAIKNELDIVKVSFGVFPEISKNYKILKSGGAMGFGCGPLLLSLKYADIESLKDKKIAIPGKNTTAFMIFKRFFPEHLNNIVEMRFDKIMPAIVAGQCDAGLVIHEGRFVYNDYGLNKIADLGNLWEEKFQCPIPLGFIALKNEHAKYADEINDTIKNSIKYADDNQSSAYAFAKKYACDMDEDVMKAHVKLYVNSYSLDMTKANKSIELLLNVDGSVFA